MQLRMSALPPIAEDMCSANRDVRFVPIADILARALLQRVHRSPTDLYSKGCQNEAIEVVKFRWVSRQPCNPTALLAIGRNERLRFGGKPGRDRHVSVSD